MIRNCFLYMTLFFFTSCNFNNYLTNNDETAITKESSGEVAGEVFNQNGNSRSSIDNITLVSLDNNSSESINQSESSNQTSLNLIVSKEKLLAKLKKQFYHSGVGLLKFPNDEDFFNILKLTPSENQVDANNQLSKSIQKLKSINSSKSKVEDLMSKVEITDGFFILKAYKINENKIYFARYDPYSYYYDYFFNGSNYGLPSNFFLRIKDSPYLIDSIISNEPFLVHHIYGDKKSIGITNNSFEPITISCKNDLTKEISTIELILEPNILYVDENGNSYSDGGSANAPPNSPNITSYTSTNNQVADVSESDRVKTDGNYIYSMHRNSFNIFDIKKGEDIGTVEIDFNSFYNATSNESSYLSPPDYPYYAYTYSVINFLNDNIIVFSQSNRKTIISFIDISKKSKPKVFKQMTFNSKLKSNRIVDGKMVLVLTKYIEYKQITFPYQSAFTVEQQNQFSIINDLLLNQLSISDFSLELTIIKTENEISETITHNDADNIYFDENIKSSSISKLVVLDSKGSVISSAGLISNHNEDIYVTAKSIFLFSTGWSDYQNSKIHYFDMQNMKLEFKGGLNLKGIPLNSFSFHEQNNYLFMAFHNTKSNDNGIHTISLGDKLKLKNTLKGMAPGESLKSVRFVNDKAFVVTFKVVDPLFIIDFAEPEKPVVLGEIKVSGYSTYLHEIYNGILVGVGYEAKENGRESGAKVSTFNVKTGNSFEVDKAVFLNTDFYGIHFNASSNHLDFVWYPAQNLLALTYSGNKKGFLVYRLNSSGAILEVANVDLDIELNNYYFDNEDKIIFVGDTLYYSENEKITAYPINKLNFSEANKTLENK